MRKASVRIVLQARTDSKRLYGKVLLPIAKLPLVILCSKRLKNKKIPLTVAIPKTKTDNNLYKVLKKNNLKVFRGSLNNVFKRYLGATQDMKENDIIVRATADNPFVDGLFVNSVLKIFIDYDLDFLDTHQSFNLPYGIAVQIVKLKVLKRLQKNKLSKYDKEHVVPFLCRKNINKSLNLKKLINSPNKLKDKRLTIDNFSDYFRIKKYFYNINEPTKIPWNKII